MQKIRRIAALIGAVLLVGMYVITLVFALMSSPAAQNMLMASIICTVVIPVMIYAMQMASRVLQGRGAKDSEADGEKGDEKEGDEKS